MKKENLEMLSKNDTYKIIDNRFNTIMRGSLYSKCKALIEKDRAIDYDDLKQNAWLALTSAANKDNRDFTNIWPLTAFAIETFRRRLSINVRDHFYIKKRNAFVSSLDTKINENSSITLYDKIADTSVTNISDNYYDYIRILEKNYYVIYNINSHKVKLSLENNICYSDFDIIFSLNSYLFDKYFLTKKELINKYSSNKFILTTKIIVNINKAIEELVNR